MVGYLSNNGDVLVDVMLLWWAWLAMVVRNECYVVYYPSVVQEYRSRALE